MRMKMMKIITVQRMRMKTRRMKRILMMMTINIFDW
jgi:hypothetical protein